MFCLENGYAIFNSNKIIRPYKPQIFLRSLSLYNKVKNEIPLSIKNSGILDINYSYNNLRFVFSSVSMNATPLLFSFKIDGLDNSWSEWTSDPSFSLQRVQPGKYCLRVKVESENSIIDEFEYPFRVFPPWYTMPSKRLVYFHYLFEFFS